MKLPGCLLLVAVVLLGGSTLAAAERIPPVPPRYFNDYAGVVSAQTAQTLNRRLEQYEKTSSNQLLVVLYPKLESASSVQDYTVRVAAAWKVGQAGKNNGAVLFAFMQSHDLYLQVGYGLEGAIPDATARRIIAQEIVPRFRSGDIDGGMTAAVDAMIAASQGEYRGTGRTVAQTGKKTGNPLVAVLALTAFAIFFIMIIRRGQRGAQVIGNPLRRRNLGANPWWNNGGGGSGGGFSGGGGSFGGGGAGGKW